jgi:hypothetical protein
MASSGQTFVGATAQEVLRRKAEARDSIERDARRGRRPHDIIKLEDFQLYYGETWQEDFARLDEVAVAAQKVRHETHVALKELKQVTGLAERIEREWAETARRELRERSLAEARKRLELE